MCNCDPTKRRTGEWCCEANRDAFHASATKPNPEVSRPTVASQTKHVKTNSRLLALRLEKLLHRLEGPLPTPVPVRNDPEATGGLNFTLMQSVDNVRECHQFLNAIEAVLGLSS